MCGYFVLLPTAMKAIASYDQSRNPIARGGFGEVWEGWYCDRRVAVKVIKTYPADGVQRQRNVIGVSLPSFLLLYLNVLIVFNTEMLQGGCSVDDPQAPKCFTTYRGEFDWVLRTRDDIRLDGEWKHQQVHMEASGQADRTRMFYTWGPALMIY